MKAISFWRQAGWVIRKDLRIELRSGEALLITVPFGALALMMAPLAIGTDADLLSRIGPGMLWLIILLFGMLVTFRATSLEAPPIRDLLALSGLDPAAAFIGRSVASAGLLLALIVGLTPVMIVLYSPAAAGGPPTIIDWGRLLALGTAAALGMALIGSLAGALVSGLRTRNALAPLLVAPLSIPVLLATTQSTDLILAGRSIMRWLLLLVAMDLALAIVGVLLAGPLEDTAG